MSKISMLQIKNSLIKNPKFSSGAFCTYAYLKNKVYLFDNNKFELRGRQVMTDLQISNTRTFNKFVSELSNLNIITEESRLNKGGSFKVEFLTDDSKQNFTQLPRGLIDKITEIGLIGFRLLYYYESYINRTKQVDRVAFAFPSYETICSDLDISKPTLSKHNKILVDKKLLSIKKHNVTNNAGMDDEKFYRFNNHYFPVLSMMLGKKDNI